MKLDQEPVKKPAHFHPLDHTLRQIAPVGEGWSARLIEILGDDACARHGQTIVVDQQRQLAGRVDLQKRQPPLPRLLLDEYGLDAELAQDKACNRECGQKG